MNKFKSNVLYSKISCDLQNPVKVTLTEFRTKLNKETIPVPFKSW